MSAVSEKQQAKPESNSKASATQDKPKSLVTDLDAFCLKRRYLEAEVPGVGLMRFQSLDTADFSEIAKHQGVDQSLTALIYCLVDEHNDRVYVDNDRTRAKLRGMDAAVLTAIAGVLNDFALGEADAGNAKKN